MKPLVFAVGALALSLAIEIPSNACADLLTVVDSIDLNLGPQTGLGFDSVTNRIFAVDNDGDVFVHDNAGSFLYGFSIPGNAGGPGREWDLDFISTGAILNGTALPANTLIATSAGDDPVKVYALDSTDGSQIASLDLPASANHISGLSFDATRGTFFGGDFIDELIYEFDPGSGAILNSFAIQPSGSPDFRLNFGDVDINPVTGNLYVITTSLGADRIREFTPDGVFVMDHGLPAGVGELAGIDFVGSTNRAWAAERNPNGTPSEVVLLSGFAVPEPEAFFMMLAAAISVSILRTKRNFALAQL